MIITISQKNFNNIHLGLCFTLLFTAYNGQLHVQQLLTVSIHQDKPDYNPQGFITFSIVYIFFTFCVWLAPYFVAVIGCRMTLAFGSICYISLVTFNYFENNWLTYASGAITGFGAALLWTAQGTYSVLNSEVGKVHSTYCIFLLFFQASEFIGNLFIYWLFNDPNQPINHSMRAEIAIFLGIFVVCSSILLAVLRPPIRAVDDSANKTTPWNEIKKTFKTLSDRQMLLSIPLFIFFGLGISFLTVIPASLGFSKYLDINSRKFAPLSGIMDGFGNIIAILLSWYMDRKSIKFFFLPTMCLYSLLSLGLIALGLPNSSVFTYTDEKPMVEIPLFILLIANIILAMTDTILNIETFDIVGSMNATDSAPSFAMFNFLKNLACTVGYFYSNYFGLQFQVIIMMFFAASTFLAYFWLYPWNRLEKIKICKNTAFRQNDQEERFMKYG